MNPGELSVRWLGRIAYTDALRMQEDLVKAHQENRVPDCLLLLEHDPVYTIGRTQDQSSLGPQPGQLPFPWIVTGRGGQATYHGPGQLVGYPILDLRRYGKDLHAYLRMLEQCLIDLALECGIAHAARREGLTGVWVRERKLASIGVGVKRWVTLHGFALNVTGDLTPFEAITPCGIGGVSMTSLALEAEDQAFTVEKTARQLVPHFEHHLRELHEHFTS